jgi:hypothetical protein
MTTFNAATQADTTNAFVTASQSAGTTAISKLTDAAIKWTYTALTPVPATGAVQVVSGSLAPSDAVIPAVGALALPTFTPFSYASLAVPALPTPPALTGATSAMWSEAFWTDLKTKLTAFTANITSADTVDTAVNTLTSDLTKMNSALYAKDYERKQQTLRDLYSAADAATGARGFSYPTSMTTALRMDAQQKFQFDMSEVSRNLITNIFEWAKSSSQFALQQSVAAHNSDVEFNIRYLDTTVKVYVATVEALIKKYQADVAALISQAEAKVKEFIGEAAALTEKVKVLNEIRLDEAKFDLAVDKVNADIAADDAKIKIADFQARVANFLETSKVDLESRDRNNKNQIQAAASAAQAAIAMAAGASTITLNTGGA